MTQVGPHLTTRRSARKACICLLFLSLVGCGGGASSSPPQAGSPTPPPTGVPQFGHVILVVEENHGYSQVIGNSGMPYLNSLATRYGLATAYYANVHPSIGNYFMLTTGQVVTTDDAFTGDVMVDNVVRQLTAAGKTWKSYAESIPSVGYTGDDIYPYVKHHNPFAYLHDVTSSSTQLQNLDSFAQFQSDLANNQLPNFSFVVPNLLNDAHDGSLQEADAWLQQNISPLIASTEFQQDGLLIITFDEADPSDMTNGGGQVATVIVSGKAKQGYRSTTLYQHQSLLRLVLQGLGLTTYPAAAGSATSMSEFFNQ